MSTAKETAKDIWLKVKAIFDAPIVAPPIAPAPNPIVAPVAAATDTPFKLKDGTDITIGIDDPAVSALPDAGDIVKIAGAPAPAGDYTLEDGTTFTTDATGAITVLTAMAPMTQPEFVAPPVPTLEQRLATLEAELAKLKTPAMPTGMATEAQLQAATQKIDKQDEIIKGLFELTEKFVDMPTADPITLSGNKKDKFDKAEAREKKFERIGQAISDLKNKSRNPVTA